MIYLILPLLLLLSACSPIGMAVGAGATLGSAAMEERGLGGAAEDLALKARINAAWLEHDFDIFRRLNCTVYAGRVLLTGYVATPEQRLEAVRRAWQDEATREVINQIEIDAGDSGWESLARDAQISASIRADMTFSSDIYAVNYALETVRGVVYIIGLAQSEDELNRVIDIARRAQYVQRVKNFVRVKSIPQGKGFGPS